MAEKVLESFEPQDLDDDGIAEAGGELQSNEEQVEALLPQSERERRQKEARQVRSCYLSYHATEMLKYNPYAGTYRGQHQCRGECPPACSKSSCHHLLQLPLPAGLAG